MAGTCLSCVDMALLFLWVGVGGPQRHYGRWAARIVGYHLVTKRTNS